MIRRAVVALIQDGNEVLMGRRNDSGKFTSPGGKVDKNETPWDALVREVKEETGLVVTDYKMVDVILDDKALVYLYKVSVKGKIDLSQDPDKEFTEIRWVNPDQVKLHYPNEINIVCKYLKKNNKNENV